MAKSSVLDVPIGANKRFLVKCDGKDFAGFDALQQAQSYITMHKSKRKGNGKAAELCYAALREWSIQDRGSQD